MIGTADAGQFRGSRKWIALAVNNHPSLLARTLGESDQINWCSPLATEGFVEFRDSSALEKLGLGHLSESLMSYWPARGPVWDALGRTPSGTIYLVEAKAHIAEMLTPGTKASDEPRRVIDKAFADVQRSLGARPRANWCDCFYQQANRLAFLHFMVRNGIDARLAHISFVGDATMDGPQSAEAFRAVDACVDYVLGLPARHYLKTRIIHATLDIAALST